jgi:hypothetical protein
MMNSWEHMESHWPWFPLFPVHQADFHEFWSQDWLVPRAGAELTQMPWEVFLSKSFTPKQSIMAFPYLPPLPTELDPCTCHGHKQDQNKWQASSVLPNSDLWPMVIFMHPDTFWTESKNGEHAPPKSRRKDAIAVWLPKWMSSFL